MKQESSATRPRTLLIEHPFGTCELSLRRTSRDGTAGWELLKLEPISGNGTVLLNASTLKQALILEEWMRRHPEVLQEGQCVFDGLIDQD